MNSMLGPVHDLMEARLPLNPPPIHPFDIKKKLNCNRLTFAAILLWRQIGSDAFQRLDRCLCLVLRGLWTDTSLRQDPKSFRGHRNSCSFSGAKMQGNRRASGSNITAFNSSQSGSAPHAQSGRDAGWLGLAECHL